MNCSKARKWLLLADAGELPAERRARLNAHVAECRECRRFARALEELRGQYTAEGAAPATPAPTLSAILAAARERRSAPVAARPAVIWWTPPRVFAAVASLFVIFSALAAALWWRRSVAGAQQEVALRERVHSAISAIETDWIAVESELAMVSLEIGDWLSADDEASPDGKGVHDKTGAGT